MKTLSIAVLALAATTTASLTAHGVGGGETEYLERFHGSWTGNGQFQKNAESDQMSVSCRMSGIPGDNRITINGACSAALLLSRQIQADLQYDPATDRYTGLFGGSVIGPATLSGRRRGDAVELTITWPKPVNGDTNATMTVHNDGSGQMRIKVVDNLEPGGPVQTTSDIVLVQ